MTHPLGQLDPFPSLSSQACRQSLRAADDRSRPGPPPSFKSSSLIASSQKLRSSMELNPGTDYDFLEASVLLVETHYQDGFKDGYDDGFISGKDDGRDVGLKLGFQTGEELGFYRGCINVWESAVRIDPTVFSTRIQRGVRQLQELVEQYPISEPENEQIQEMMEAIRIKFKVVSANLGVKLEYEGYPKSSKQGMEDM